VRIIAFAGPKGSGKDTAAKYLLARNSLLQSNTFIQANFADTLKLATELLFGFTPQELNDPALKEVVIERWPHKCPREVLQNLANLLRTMYAPDIFVRAWVRRVNQMSTETNCILVTDLRHIEEVDKLREMGAKIVYVNNPRVEQLRLEGRQNGDPLWSDSSEALAEALKTEADIIIENNGHDFQTLWGEVHRAVNALYPEWHTWHATTDNALPLNTPVQRAL